MVRTVLGVIMLFRSGCARNSLLSENRRMEQKYSSNKRYDTRTQHNTISKMIRNKTIRLQK